MWPALVALLLCPIGAIAQNAYITNVLDNTVSVINTSTSTVIATIPGFTNPVSAAVTPDGSHVYITNGAFADTVSVVNTASNTITATIPISLPALQNLSGIAISPDGGTAYVTTVQETLTSAYVIAIDTASNTVITALSVPGDIDLVDVAVTPDGTKLYVTNEDGTMQLEGILYVLSTNPLQFLTTVPVCPNDGAPFALAITPDGAKVYVTCPNTREVDVLSTASESIIATIPTGGGPGGGPFAIAITPDGTKAYVALQSSLPAVLDINTSTNTITGSIPVPSARDGAASTPDGTLLYVTNDASESVSVINTATDTVVHTVTVGNYPDTLGQFIQPASDGSGGPPQNAELLGPKDCGCVGSTGATSAGEPIDVASGNMAYQFTDYTTAGQRPLAFTRYYNSRGNASGIVTLASTLGVNWRSNFDRYLQINSSSQVTAERIGGKQYIFTLRGSTWSSNGDVDIKLTHSGSTWTLTDHDDTVETYTTTSSGHAALLNTIQARNGYTQTLNYNGSNQLTNVTDSYRRAFSLTYNGNGTLETVTTPDSSTLTYGYNSVTGGTQLTSVSYSTNPISTQQYLYTQSSLPFALTGIIDENGNRYTTWSYDSYGRGLTSQLGSGATLTTMSYVTGATTVTNALGVQDTYTFTTSQNVPKISQISRAATSTTAAAAETFSYDGSGYMASRTDWNSNQTTYVNDSHGDPTTINEAMGTPVARTTTIVYDSRFVHLPHSIATPGVTTAYAYDSSGNLLTKTLTDTTTQSIPYSTHGEAQVWTYTWNNSLLASVETPNLKITNYTYSPSGALTRITNPLNQTTSITLNSGGGYPEAVVDPNGVTTTLTYDARQRLISSAVTTSAGVLTTTYTIDPASELTKVTLPDNSYLAYGYDTAHRLTKTTDELGNYIQYTLDSLGDKTQINTYDSGSDLKRQHSATFDALGRMLTDVGGSGQTTRYTYDSNGNALTVTDPLNHLTTRVFDALNRLTQSTDPNNGVAQFSYDAHDRLLTVSDPDSNATTYVRDGFGNGIQQASPDSGTSVYYYDADNNLVRKVDALSVMTNNSFDALDRILATQYPADPTLNVAYTYDQTGTGYGFGIGHLTSLTDAAGSLSRSHDERGNMLTEKRINGTHTLTTTYTYDRASRIAAITYPDGWQITDLYDSAGYLHQVKARPFGSIGTSTIATLAHLPFGPVDSAIYGNGITEGWTFDADYRATNLTDSLSSTHLQNLTYGYDEANNVTSISDAVNAANSQTLGYDALNRLISATSGTGGYGSLNWVYDKNGNLTSFKVGSATTLYTYIRGTNRLASFANGGPSHLVGTNANGNITNIPPANSSTFATFAYSKANRLASVTGSPLAATFVYDAFGRRFSKTNPGASPTLYTYSQDGRLIEENDNGATTDYLYADGRPISTLQPSLGPSKPIDYILADRLGTPQLATNISGSTVWSTTYQPYGTTGTITGSITQNLRLPGQNTDAETGFNYNLNRDYMPNIGRYLETDPIGIRGSLNTYGYANANPAKLTDRSGLQEEEEEDIGEEENEVQNEINQTAYNNALQQLRQLDPSNPDLTYMTLPGWVPTEQDVENAENELRDAEAQAAPQRCTPLQRLHPDSTLLNSQNSNSYNYWSQQPTADIINSLQSGEEPLTVDQNGLVWQGNMRIMILEQRSVDVGSLPRLPK
jgi:RHS repeat-associated protein